MENYRKDFGVRIARIYTVCQSTFDSDILELYWSEIKKYNFEYSKIANALDKILLRSRPGRLFCFDDLIMLIEPSKLINEIDEARLLAKKIIASLSRHGYLWPMSDGYDPYPTFKDSFIAELGEFAWLALEQYGGYGLLHDDWAKSDSNFEPRLRDYLSSLRKFERAGDINPRIGMTESKKIGEEKKLEKLTYWL